MCVCLVLSIFTAKLSFGAENKCKEFEDGALKILKSDIKDKVKALDDYYQNSIESSGLKLRARRNDRTGIARLVRVCMDCFAWKATADLGEFFLKSFKSV